MSGFEIGDKVVCVEPAPGIYKDAVYIVHGTKRCLCSALVDVGVKSSNFSPSDMDCPMDEDEPYMWYVAPRFVKVDDNIELSELTIEDVLKETELEVYEVELYGMHTFVKP